MATATTQVRSQKTQANVLQLPALEVRQGKDRRLYTFAVDGKQLHSFSTIRRISRPDEEIEGYQRPEVVSHISEIRRYLESENPMLPNAIVIAFDDRVKFRPNRSTKGPHFSRSGILEIPVDPGLDETEKSGWIVDGQQRAAAIRDARIDSFPVCVVGFLTNSTAEQREQFILVNATKPLPKGLIYELLPSTEGRLPSALQQKRFPARLLERLNHDTDSPLMGCIKTPTNGDGIIADNSILNMLENSLSDGVLYRLGDEDEMLTIVKRFWEAVSIVFPDAWDKPPRRSRLTHGAGIKSMGFLMDTIADRHRDVELTKQVFVDDLLPLVDECRWTEGYWDFGPGEQFKWNEVQNIPKHIQRLSNYLLVKYKERVWNRTDDCG